MKVVWSEEATWALVALEARLARRHSPDRAARIVEQLVASTAWRIIRSSAASCLNTDTGSCGS